MNNIFPDLKIVIICWPGVEENAKFISKQLEKAGYSPAIIYSTKKNSNLNGPGQWIKVSDEFYYGRKFLKIITEFSYDILLQIHADAFCDDWLGLVERCYSIHCTYEYIGVWSPTPDNSAWQNNEVFLSELGDSGLISVAQTDCIVWSIKKTVSERLKKMNITKNNLGWGIDWAAICFCYCSGYLVVRDLNFTIKHKLGTGYLANEAGKQMNDFLEELSTQEKIMYHLLRKSILVNRLK